MPPWTKLAAVPPLIVLIWACRYASCVARVVASLLMLVPRLVAALPRVCASLLMAAERALASALSPAILLVVSVSISAWMPSALTASGMVGADTTGSIAALTMVVLGTSKI